ncbi:hypothetical protein ACFY3J_35685 [Streptomyces sp. NPDC001231]|uniref:hypothetical protein n=1 Tax=unclassified Streptomyces TaxID=2593676 RepID=UPI003674DAB8
MTPPGTLSVRPGIGAGIVVRGLLCAVYFGSEAFIPLGLTELRDLSATQVGLGLSAGALAWVVGSALQARRDASAAAGGRRQVRGVALGSAVLLAGVLITGGAMLVPSIPALLAVLGWTVGGLGMGIAFNAATTDTMEQAAAGQQGTVSAALQLAQTLATALISGLGGAAIAIAHAHGSTTRAALLCVFAATGLPAALAVLASGRLRPRTA